MAPYPFIGELFSALLLETVAYGAFLVAYGMSTVTLLRGRIYRQNITKRMNTILLTITGTLFLLITAFWIVSAYSLFAIYVNYADQKELLIGLPYFGPLLGLYHLAIIQRWPFAAVTTIYTCGCLIADCYLIFRLYIIWGRNRYICVMPLISVTVLLVATSVWEEIAKANENQLLLNPQGVEAKSGPWALAAMISTIATNVYSTCLIAWRIYSENRAIQKLGLVRSGSNPSMRALAIVVESASLYTFCTLLVAVLIVLKSDLATTGAAITLPIMGISFCLIIIRVGNGTSASSHVAAELATIVASRTGRNSKRLTNLALDNPNEGIAMGPMTSCNDKDVHTGRPCRSISGSSTGSIKMESRDLEGQYEEQGRGQH